MCRTHRIRYAVGRVCIGLKCRIPGEVYVTVVDRRYLHILERGQFEQHEFGPCRHNPDAVLVGVRIVDTRDVVELERNFKRRIERIAGDELEAVAGERMGHRQFRFADAGFRRQCLHVAPVVRRAVRVDPLAVVAAVLVQGLGRRQAAGEQCCHQQHQALSAIATTNQDLLASTHLPCAGFHRPASTEYPA
jgi:hypothetical protein